MVSAAAFADIKDYKFVLVDRVIQTGPDKIIAVKLINTRTGKPVSGAVIPEANQASTGSRLSVDR